MTKPLANAPKPLASGAKPGRCAFVGWTHDDDQEEGGKHHFGHQAGNWRVALGRMRAVAVRRKAAGRAEARLTARDDVEHDRRKDGTDDLGAPVRRAVFGVEAPAGSGAQYDCRIEVGARDVADRAVQDGSEYLFFADRETPPDTNGACDAGPFRVDYCRSRVVGEDKPGVVAGEALKVEWKLIGSREAGTQLQGLELDVADACIDRKRTGSIVGHDREAEDGENTAGLRLHRPFWTVGMS
ncbi:MAG: hypothetical protein GDA49_02260 [Rhodospirillales bacterium]|nr:hypothetical protein [Rhodospirillales bacterium]